MINIDLLKNPINWIIVILMLFIAGFFGTFLCRLLSNSTMENVANG